jgi:signal transduction histidine kinase
VKRLLSSLAGRVALVCALGFVVSGATLALVTGVLFDRLTRQREDEHLRDAAGTLAFELSAPDADPMLIAEDETRELAHTGMRVAIHEGRRFVSGDRVLGAMLPNSCIDQGSLRMCALPAKSWTVIIARDTTPLREHRESTIKAASVAVVLTSMLGTVLAFLIARSVLKPLSRLREAVQRVPENDPGAAQLGADENVAEVDTLRATLHSAFVRLGAALAQSRRFASDAAHQLRTPLTAVIGELDLASERATDAHDEIARARKVARRLSTLIDRLLILAQAERATHAHHEVDLLDVIEDAIETLPPHQRARVTFTGSSELVIGDSALLVAMLESAIENALKFSQQAVRVSLEVRTDVVVLAVEDEGPGVPSAESERVFAPFYRIRAAQTAAVAGHGLGLALIAHIATLHGGGARFVERARGARLEMLLQKAGEANHSA